MSPTNCSLPRGAQTVARPRSCTRAPSTIRSRALTGAERYITQSIDRVFALVFEAEIDVAAGSGLGPRDLAHHPNVERRRLDRALQSPIEIGYRIDEDLFVRGHGAEPSTTQNLALTLTSAPLRALEGAELREDAGLPY